ncbi:Uncharacterised protein [Mycobacteroides abscessus subsp. abscessus]|nr:Uncharacterised protein [Mycobacteroides abscessus subsp. abscessus]
MSKSAEWPAQSGSSRLTVGNSVRSLSSMDWCHDTSSGDRLESVSCHCNSEATRYQTARQVSSAAPSSSPSSDAAERKASARASAGVPTMMPSRRIDTTHPMLRIFSYMSTATAIMRSRGAPVGSAHGMRAATSLSARPSSAALFGT